MPSKRKKKRRIDTNDFDSDPPPKKAATMPSAKPGKKRASSSEGAGSDVNGKMFALSETRFVSVKEFRGRRMIDIREFDDSDGQLKPRRKGISLSLDEWRKLKERASSIDKIIESSSAFEPRNLRDIFKENNDVDGESYEEKPRLNGNSEDNRARWENEEETPENVKKYEKDERKKFKNQVSEFVSNGDNYGDIQNGNQYRDNEEHPSENVKSQRSFGIEEEDCPFRKLNNEAKRYFKRVFGQLKDTFESAEDEEIFYKNVLEEIAGQESFLSATRLGSQCLELIFVKCKNAKLVRRFLEAFTTDLYPVCVDFATTHVTQALLVCCLRLIHAKEECRVSDEDCTYFEEWVVKICQFCIENLEDFIFHETNSSYVIRTLLSVLGGKSLQSGINRTVRAYIQSTQSDHYGSPTRNYANTPSSFVHLFKKIAKKIFKNEKFVEIVKTETGSPIIQILLLVSSENFPTFCQKAVKTIAKKILRKEETESISTMFEHQYASYIIEIVVKVANAETRSWLWDRYFQDQFKELCLDAIGNFIAQKIIKTCESKEEFEKIYEIMEPLMDEIFNRGYSALFSKLSETCFDERFEM